MTLADITAFVEQNRLLAAPIVLLLAFGESIAFVSLVLPFWGMLIAIGAALGASGLWNLDFLMLWIAASIGAALGDWVSYWLGFRYHDQIAKMWPLSRYPQLLPRGHAFFEKYGVWAIVLGRFSGPLRASVPLVAGATEMTPWKFQLANWSSAFLWAFVLLIFGGGIGEALAHLAKILGMT